MSKLSSHLSPHLTEEVVDRLAKKNINSFLTFLEADSELLAQISGLNYRALMAIKDEILVKFASKCQSCKNYSAEICEKGALMPSGIQKLDDLLDGGLFTGHLYELCGESGTGKSQLCMMIAANVTGKFKQKVFYVDTKEDFSAHRISSFLEIMTGDATGSLGRITVTRPDTIYKLLSCLFDYVKRSEATKECARLVVVDSVATLFSGMSDIKKMNKLLSNLADVLHYIAVELHSIVLLTNHLSIWEGKQAVGMGKFWLSIPQFRIILKRIPSNSQPSYSCTLERASILPLGRTTTVQITDERIS